ncbi:hypothetical protein J2125_000360 [Erwinia toletana]|uniref:Uncharacterized protein n=1 Tax=Winslowiella toletana TaxID=92490 RepID=A0ABS4P3D4_9GAMM|nr:hypothetical protein [Winslowiella toletana]
MESLSSRAAISIYPGGENAAPTGMESVFGSRLNLPCHTTVNCRGAIS